MKKEDMLIFSGVIVALTGLAGIALGWTVGINQSKNQCEIKQKIEDRKGKCVEYKKYIDPVTFQECEYCIKWNDINNPEIFIYN